MKQKIRKAVLILTLSLFATTVLFSQANNTPAVKTIKDSEFNTGDVVMLPAIGLNHENLGKLLRSPSNMDTMSQVIAFLKKYPKLVVEVGFHSDCKGQDNFNQTWTENLAKSYVAYLVEKGGFSAERFVAVGYGKTKPLTLQYDLVLPGKKIIPAGTSLTQSWIDSNYPAEKKKEDNEFIMKQNRRGELIILKTDFAK